MKGFLAAVHTLGNGLVFIQPLSATDPGFGGGVPPTDPGYGRPEWGDRPDQGLPGFGHPDNSLPGGGYPSHGLPGGGYPSHGLPGYGHPSHPLPVPPPAGVVSPPIVLPDRPSLPAGSGVVVPLPDGVPLPTPTGEVPAGAKPYVLWYGPGTQSTVVYLQPSTPTATPK